MSVVRVTVVQRRNSCLAIGLDVDFVVQEKSIGGVIAKFQQDLYASINLGRQEDPEYHFWRATHKAPPTSWRHYNLAMKYQNFELSRVRAPVGMPFKELAFYVIKKESPL